MVDWEGSWIRRLACSAISFRRIVLTLDRRLHLALPAVVLLLLVTRRLRVDRGMLWPLGALLLLFFAMPMALFGAWAQTTGCCRHSGCCWSALSRPAESVPGRDAAVGVRRGRVAGHGPGSSQ